MSPSLDGLRLNKRIMAYTAAAMYGGAAFDGLIEGFLPGDPSFAITPVIVSVATVALLCLAGPHVPRRVLAPLGPLGVVLIAYAVSTTPGAGDGAVLYMWPVLWSTFYLGRRGAIVIVACVAVAHAVTLLALPATSSYPGRWVDVMVSVSGGGRRRAHARARQRPAAHAAGRRSPHRQAHQPAQPPRVQRARRARARAGAARGQLDRDRGERFDRAARGARQRRRARGRRTRGHRDDAPGADFALYRAKRAGRDRTVVFERSVSPFATHRTNTSHDQVPV